ncbi:hypothetical protein [Stappia indica]|uniref:hypothetical protein n=1 Tax=Stappia indica TaxID=538381 RepID=UPI0011126599|nr:hypothetical protein [Stappia indica]
MQYELPTSDRVAVHRAPEGAVIIVRAKRHLLIMAFFLFWLCGWTVGGFSAAGALVSGAMKGNPSLFLVAWLGAWAVGWVLATASVLWMFAGKEQLVVTRTGVTKTVSIPILSRSWHYNPAHIARIRRHVVPQPLFGQRGFDNPLGTSGGVAFDYGQTTVTFGTSIDDAEARLIMEALNEGLGRTGVAA